jgi:hypothetical protein
MARGNDSQAAAAEFRGQYGVMGNAEDLIQANRAAFPAELRKTLLTKPTSEVEDDDLDPEKVAKALGVENGTVLRARQRGGKVVAVVETESGHTYKAITDAESASKGRQRDEAESESTPDERVAEAQAEAQRIIAEARAEAERTIEDARQRAIAEASEAAAKAKLEADEQAAKEAQKAENEANGGEPPKARRATPPAK